jgi:hypothetical protein
VWGLSIVLVTEPPITYTDWFGTPEKANWCDDLQVYMRTGLAIGRGGLVYTADGYWDIFGSVSWAECCGFVVAHCHHYRDGESLGLRIPFWALFLLFACYPSIAFIEKWSPFRRRRRRKLGLCVRCGYNLTGNVSGVCPECGDTI